jgi:hypothetical protein
MRREEYIVLRRRGVGLSLQALVVGTAFVIGGMVAITENTAD